MANTYTIHGTRILAAASPDPALCRITGNLISVLGVPLRGYGLTVRHIYSPLSLGTSALVLREAQRVEADRNGLLSFDLLRGSTVRIEITNRPDLAFQVEVPNQAALDLADLILPYVVSVAFDDAPQLDVTAGLRFSISTTGLLSNGQSIDTGVAVELQSSNTNVVVRESSNQYLALSAGSVTVSALSIDDSRLNINKSPAGDPIVRLGVPASVLPAPLIVVVT